MGFTDIEIQNKYSFLSDFKIYCLYTVFTDSVDVILTVAIVYMVLNFVLKFCHQTYVLLSFFNLLPGSRGKSPLRCFKEPES